MHLQAENAAAREATRPAGAVTPSAADDNHPSMVRAVAEACCVCLLVALFFSPHVTAWRAWSWRPDIFDQCETGRAAVALWQVDHLGEPVEHKYQSIQRWRFLFPAVARALRLPATLHLLLYPTGALLAVAYLSWILQPFVAGWWRLAALTAITANAWFFTATGWLGYSDGWVALGLLAVAFSSSAAATAVACFTLPWCDDRFVIGLPVAVGVSSWWLLQGTSVSTRAAVWSCAARLVPVAVPIAVFVAARLAIEARSDVNMLDNPLFPPLVDNLQTVAWGAWECLRAAWVLVILALLPTARSQAWPSLMLAAATAASFAPAFFVPYDLSRAGVVLLPLACLGVQAAASRNWQRWFIPVVGALNLLLPASHVMVTQAGPSIVPIRALYDEYLEWIRPTEQYDPTTYVEAAVRQAVKKDFAAAEWLLQIARDLRGDEAAVVRAAALILAEKGAGDEARKQLEGWLAGQPHDITSAALLAVILEEAGLCAEAIVVARRIIDDHSPDQKESADAIATAQRVISRCQEHGP
jgi:hypothetical protein